MNLPRVLVIASNQFNRQAGGGVTMGNLFRGWPFEALAQLHSDTFTKADESVCRNYKFIPTDYLTAVPLKGISAILPRHNHQNNGGHNHQATEKPEHWLRLQMILSWCRQFKPDVIYARPTNGTPYYWWLPRYLARHLGIPYVTHTMDDWPARYLSQQGKAHEIYWKPLLRRSLQSLFDGAAARIAISEEMCQAFQSRYGQTFTPFHNCIDVPAWANIPKTYDTIGDFRVIFLGAVTPDKELQSLIDIKDTILWLRQEGYPIRLYIHSAPQWHKVVQDHLAHDPGIVNAGYVHPTDLPKTLSQADLLVLPINFDKHSLTYVGYSLQTKVPEYMASGTPTLVYGPPTSPNVRYANQAGWAVVVDQRHKEKLQQAIINLITDKRLRSDIGQRARDLAFQNHDATQIRQKFRRLMAEAAFSSSNALL